MTKDEIQRSKFKDGDIVFVVEPNNTIIGEVTGKTMSEGVMEIRPRYFKYEVNTTSIWTKPSYIQAVLGRDKNKVLTEYAEYFV